MKIANMDDKVCVITGANTGIGQYTALALAQAGAHVVLASRSRERTQPVLDEIAAKAGADKVSFVALDLNSLASVRAAAAEILEQQPRIDVLVNNAGVGGAHGLTDDGFEQHFGINHLGHFLLTELLLDRIRASAPSRIVTVSSRAHYRARHIDFDKLKSPTKSVSGMPEYQVSKLANVLFSVELDRRLKGSGVSTYALHPGVVASDIWRTVPALVRPLIKLFMITSEEGAYTSLHCASAPEVQDQSGLYWDRCKTKKASRPAHDEQLAAELWRRSEQWVH
ncbi:MAG: SDR family oxidoreductase [Bradymonadaceae bacterium]|nr:SDR family oxidoreductase [Lujinxingiaceae bacterium]